MMRRAFTLIELLVIVALLGTLATVAVMSIQKGRDVARLKGSVRDVFATIRIARSIALVSQKPCVITFSTKNREDGCVSNVEIVSGELLGSKTGAEVARTLDGVWKNVATGEAVDVRGRKGSEVAAETFEDGGGESIEEILFEPVDAKVFESIRLKVVMDDEETEDAPGEVDEARKSMISTFSNVDFLLGAYKEERKKKNEAAVEGKTEAQSAETPPPASASGEETEKSLAWQVNGRCEPHTVYVYVDGEDWQSGWRIRVDRFGAAKIYSPGEDER